VVDVRLVEAAPVAGALRFELLSEGRVISRGRRREAARTDAAPLRQTEARAHPGRSPRKKNRKSGQNRDSNKTGKSKRGKSW
jgi:ribonuclease R